MSLRRLYTNSGAKPEEGHHNSDSEYSMGEESEEIESFTDDEWRHFARIAYGEAKFYKRPPKFSEGMPDKIKEEFMKKYIQFIKQHNSEKALQESKRIRESHGELKEIPEEQ